MAAFYTDEDVALALAELLADARTLDIETAHAAHQLEQLDDAQFLYAVQHDRTFITHNRKDYTLIHDAWLLWNDAAGGALGDHHGVLILRQDQPDELANRIDEFLNTNPVLTNEAYWWRGPTAPGAPTWWRRVDRGWAPYNA